MMFPNLNSNEQVKKMKFKVLAMQDTGRSLKLLLCKHTYIWALTSFLLTISWDLNPSSHC